MTTAAGDRDRRAGNDSELLSRAFYPLTLPLTVGPGSLSVAVTLGANATRSMSQGLELVDRVAARAGGDRASPSICPTAGRRASSALVGKSAMSVFLRLSSFILLCIGIQIVWNGVRALWLTLPPR